MERKQDMCGSYCLALVDHPLIGEAEAISCLGKQLCRGKNCDSDPN